MVADPGAEAGAGRLRPLNPPRPITIRAQANRPVILVSGRQRRRIEEIQDSWRIDDEWWRAPIGRRYYRVVLDDGSLRTIYHDLVDDGWYEQAY